MSEDVLEQDEDTSPQVETTQDNPDNGYFYPEQTTSPTQTVSPDNVFKDLIPQKSNGVSSDNVFSSLIPKKSSKYEDNVFKDLIPENKTSTEKAQETGAIESGVLHAAMNVVPMTAGLVAGGLAGIAGTALELNPITGLFTGIAAGVAGSMGAAKAQDALLKTFLSEDTYKALQDKMLKTSEEHPVASFAGEVSPMLLGASPSIRNVGAAAKSLAGIRALAQEVKAGNKVAEAAWNNLTNVAVNGAIQGGLSTAQQAIQGDVNWGRVGADTLVGMTLNNPNKIGEFLTFHGIHEGMIKDKTIAQLDATNKDADMLEQSGAPLTANEMRKEGIDSAVKENLTTEIPKEEQTVAKNETVEPVAENATTETPKEETSQLEPAKPEEVNTILKSAGLNPEESNAIAFDRGNLERENVTDGGLRILNEDERFDDANKRTTEYINPKLEEIANREAESTVPETRGEATTLDANARTNTEEATGLPSGARGAHENGTATTPESRTEPTAEPRATANEPSGQQPDIRAIRRAYPRPRIIGDIIDHIIDELGGIQSIGRAREIYKSKGLPMGGEYDGQPKNTAYIFKANGVKPDVAAQMLFDAGWLKEPSVDEMWRAIESARDFRIKNKQNDILQKQDEQEYNQQVKAKKKADEKKFKAYQERMSSKTGVPEEYIPFSLANRPEDIKTFRSLSEKARTTKLTPDEQARLNQAEKNLGQLDLFEQKSNVKDTKEFEQKQIEDRQKKKLVGEPIETQQDMLRTPEEANGQKLLFSKETNKINLERIEQIKSDVKEIADKLPIKVEVADNEEGLPQNIKDYAKKRGLEGSVGGFFSPKENKIYIVADKHLNGEHAVKTLMEEAFGHAGMRRVLKPEQFNQILDAINKPEHVRDMQRIADQYKLDMNVPEQRREAAEEFLAKLARNEIQNPTLWDKIVSYVRQFLRDMGIKMDFSDHEIRNLLAKSRDAMLNEKGIETEGEPRFSVSDKTHPYGGKERLRAELPEDVFKKLDEEGKLETTAKGWAESEKEANDFIAAKAKENKTPKDILGNFDKETEGLSPDKKGAIANAIRRVAEKSGDKDFLGRSVITATKNYSEVGRALNLAKQFGQDEFVKTVAESPEVAHVQDQAIQVEEQIHDNKKIVQRVEEGLKKTEENVIHQSEITQEKVAKNISRKVKELEPKLKDIADQLGYKIKDLIHHDANDIKSIGELVSELLYQDAQGLDPAHIEKLSKYAQDAFENMVKKAQAQELVRLTAGKNKVARAMRDSSDKILDIVHMGGKLTDENVYSAIKDKLGLPEYDPVKGEQMQKLAQEILKMPDGQPRDQKIAELNVMRQDKSWGGMLGGIWYANILSGYSTQAVHSIGRVELGLTNLGISMANDIAHGRMEAVPETLKGFIDGFSKGLVKAGYILKTGYNFPRASQFRGSFSHLEVYPQKWLLPWKMVGRAIRAADEVFYNASNEARTMQLASETAIKEGLSGDALSRRVAQLADNTEMLKNHAIEQAKNEGLVDAKGNLTHQGKIRAMEITEKLRPDTMRQETDDYAKHSTYNYAPEGALGAIANGLNHILKNVPLLRGVQPFTNIVANLTDVSLDFTPWGYKRAFLGKGGGKFATEAPTGRLYQEQLWKASLGTLAMGSLYALAKSGIIDVTGVGPSDYNHKQQLQANGWKAESLKVGNTYFTYSHSPLGVALSIVGNYLDAQKYNKFDEKDLISRTCYAIYGSGQALMEQSFLSGLARFMGSLSDKNSNPEKEAAALLTMGTTGFVVPNIARQIQSAFTGGAVYEAKGFWQDFIKQIPVANALTLNKSVNVLGQDVEYNAWNRFIQMDKQDPVWNLIAEKSAFISKPSKLRKLGDRYINPDEYYKLVKNSGEQIYNEISSRLDEFRDMDSESVQKEVQAITKSARDSVMDELRSDMVEE